MLYEMKTRKFWRSQLPHWEVERGYYFITLRCAGSLPQPVLAQIKEVYASLKVIKPNDAAFAELQRRYFQTVEKYADANKGFCPFRTDACANAVIEMFSDLEAVGWQVPHFAIMPNHLHFIARVDTHSSDMHTVLSRWKGATSRKGNSILKRSGAFWQREWFDRVVRSPNELERTVAYIQNNPVKGGLCKQWRDYKYVK